MSAGVALVLTVQFLAGSASDDLSESVPPTGARLLLMNVQPEQLTGLAALLSATPGISRRPVILPFYVASVAAVDGRPIGDMPSAGPAGLDRRWLAAGVDPDSGVVVEQVHASHRPVSLARGGCAGQLLSPNSEK